MRLKFFVFVVALLVVTNSDVLLAVHSSNAHEESSQMVGTLVENICDLLVQGHSTSQIVTILEASNVPEINISALVLHVHDMLQEKQSKDLIVSDIKTNKESEKFYAQANFWARMKRYYFVLKVLVVIGIGLGIYFYWRHQKNNRGGNFQGRKQGAQSPQKHDEVSPNEKEDSDHNQEFDDQSSGIYVPVINHTADIQDPESSSEEVEYPDPHLFITKNHDLLERYMHNYELSPQDTEKAEGLYPGVLKAIAEFQDYPVAFDVGLAEIMELEIA